MIDALGIRGHLEWRRRTGVKDASGFQKTGFAELDTHMLDRDLLLQCFDPQNRRVLSLDDVSDDYWPFPVNQDIIDELNGRHHFFGPPPRRAQDHLQAFLDANRTTIETELGSGFVITNVRFDALLPGQSYGPSQWHTDGGPRFLRKVLLYPGPLAKDDSGALEFFDRRGERHLLQSQRPVAVLYDTAILLHRGHPPRWAPRPMIEITLYSAPETDTRPVFAGHLSRVPKITGPRLDNDTIRLRNRLSSAWHSTICPGPWPSLAVPSRFDRAVQRLKAARTPGDLFRLVPNRLRRRLGVGDHDTLMRDGGPVPYLSGQIVNKQAFVAISGGPNCALPGWLNLDERDLEPGYRLPALGPESLIPLVSGSAELVLADKTLGRFDDHTIERLFEEVHRVLAPSGRFLIHLPDHAGLLDAWNRSDAGAIRKRWAMTSSGGPDDGRAPQIEEIFARAFCAFLSEDRPQTVQSPSVSQSVRADLAGTTEPHDVARRLKEAVGSHLGPVSFIRQNAWSRAKILRLLAQAGLRAEPLPDRKARRKFGWLPRLRGFDVPAIWIEARRAS